MLYYFSGCGNSQFIAESIAKSLGEQLVFIPAAERESRFNYDLADGERVGFVFPTYSWRPPQLVMDFVKKLHFSRQPEYVWMAITCGGNVGVADEVFAKQLLEVGLKLDAAFCFVMPNTYVNMAGMSIDNPAKAKRKIHRVKSQLPDVIGSITERKTVWDMRRGAFPRFKTNVIGKSFDKWVTDKPFHTTDACISCGKCVEVCPLQNIALDEGRPRWHGNCINCEACYHHCPTNAIQFGNATKGKGQYYFGKE